ncbi:hypothetical protein ACFQ7B_06395 [Streptomyces erythrochromogenes]|uniref:hypothetical protein n=1 Tax=Streptomyces erythrochromogenes TaxID=285574 RepID=UPI0036C90A52
MGVRLPAAPGEAYRLLGRRRDLTGNHDVLLDPAELYVDDAEEALVFRRGNQGAASWGILLDGLTDDDPAVLVRPDLAVKSAERWENWLDRLSLCFGEIDLQALRLPPPRRRQHRVVGAALRPAAVPGLPHR